MRTSIFNRHVFSETFRQQKMVGLTTAILYMIYEILAVVGVNIAALDDGNRISFMQEELIFYPMVAIVVLVTPLLILIGFGFINGRNTSDFYHAIPHKRITIYISNLLAALAWIAIDIIVAFTFLVGMSKVLPYVDISISATIMMVIKTMIACIFIASAFVLGMNLSGTFFTGIISALLIIVVPRSLIIIIMHNIDTATNFAPLDEFVQYVFAYSNVVLQYVGIADGDYLNTTIGIVPTIVEAIVYITVAAFVFVRRPSESAQKSSIHPAVGAVFRIAVSLIPSCSAVTLALTTDYSESPFAINALIVLAIATYFLYELITTKSFEKVKRSLIFFPIPIVLSVIVFFIGGNAVNKINAYRPDIGKLDYAIVEKYPYRFDDMMLDNDKILNRDNLAILAKNIGNDIDDFYGRDYFVVNFSENGKQHRREVYIKSEEYTEIIKEMMGGNPAFKYSAKDTVIEVLNVACSDSSNVIVALQKMIVENTDYVIQNWGTESASIELFDVNMRRPNEYSIVNVSYKFPELYKLVIAELSKQRKTVDMAEFIEKQSEDASISIMILMDGEMYATYNASSEMFNDFRDEIALLTKYDNCALVNGNSSVVVRAFDNEMQCLDVYSDIPETEMQQLVNRLLEGGMMVYECEYAN